MPGDKILDPNWHGTQARSASEGPGSSSLAISGSPYAATSFVA